MARVRQKLQDAENELKKIREFSFERLPCPTCGKKTFPAVSICHECGDSWISGRGVDFIQDRIDNSNANKTMGTCRLSIGPVHQPHPKSQKFVPWITQKEVKFAQPVKQSAKVKYRPMSSDRVGDLVELLRDIETTCQTVSGAAPIGSLIASFLLTVDMVEQEQEQGKGTKSDHVGVSLKP